MAMTMALASCGSTGPAGNVAPSASRIPDAIEDMPARVEVACGPETTVVSTEVVRASRDGVTFDVSGKAGSVFLVVDGDSQDVLLLQQDRSSFTTRAIPGDAIVACGDPNDHGIETAPGPSATLRIEDPDGWYRSIEADHSSSGCADDAMPSLPWGRGIEVPPIVQARSRIRNLEPGDSIERGGWPADEGVVRVVRQGRAIGVLRFLEDATGGWLLAMRSPVRRAEPRPWLSEVAPEGNPNSAPCAALSLAARS